MSRYIIKSIEKVTAPYGMVGDNWFQFVISNDINTINGFRSGSKREVLKIVQESVNRMNEKYSTNFKVKNFNKPVQETGNTLYI